MPLRRDSNGNFVYTPDDPPQIPRTVNQSPTYSSDLDKVRELRGNQVEQQRSDLPDFGEFTTAFQRLNEQLGQPPAGATGDPFTDQIMQAGDRTARQLVGGEYARLQAAGEDAAAVMQGRLQQGAEQIREASGYGLGDPEFYKDRLFEGFQMLKAGVGGAMETFSKSAFALEPFEPGDRFRPMRTRRPEFTPEQREQIDGAIQQRGVEIQERAMAAFESSAGKWNPSGSDPIEFIVGETLRMLPLTSVSLAAGVIGGGVGGAGVGAMLGGTAGFGTSYFAERAFLVDELVEEGLSREEALEWATAAAVPIAAMESVFDAITGGMAGRAAAQLTAKEAISEMAKKSAAQRIAAIAKTWIGSGAVEGSTEGIQELMAVYTNYLATGEMPEGVSERIAQAVLAGAAAGSTIGGGVAGVQQGVEANAVRRMGEYAEAARNDFNPALTPVGTEIGGVKKGVDANGREYWYDPATGRRAAAPSSTEYAVEAAVAADDARLAAETEKATRRGRRGRPGAVRDHLNLSFTSGAEEIARLTSVEGISSTDPTTLADIARINAVYYMRTARALVNPDPKGRVPISDDEALTRASDLELLALSPESPLSAPARAQALGQSIALQEAVATSKGRQVPNRPQNVSELDLAAGAYHLAREDEAMLEEMAIAAEQKGDRAGMEAIREAYWIKRNEQRINNDTEELKLAVDTLSAMRPRGMAKGSYVIMPDGTPNQVAGVEKSGFLMVSDGQGGIKRVNPSEVTIVPEPGQYVEMGRVVGKVAAVDEQGAHVDIPGKGMTIIRLDEIDNVGAFKEMRKALGARYHQAGEILKTLDVIGEQVENAPAEAVARQEEEINLAHAAKEPVPSKTKPRRKKGGKGVRAAARTRARSAAPAGTPTTNETGDQVLPAPVPVKDKRTGKQSQVVEVRQDDTALLDDGSVVPTGQLAAPGEAMTPLSEAKEIGTFAAGTRPSAKGRNINFILVPNDSKAEFEQLLLKANSSQKVFDALTMGQAHIMPQTKRANMTQYAVEMPESARRLTPAGKRLLGALGGKGVKKITNNSMRSRLSVTLDPALTPDAVAVERIPDALLAPVIYTNAFFNTLPDEQKLEYMRRLTDLGFGLDNHTVDVIEGAEQAAAIEDAAMDEVVAGAQGVGEKNLIVAKAARAEVVAQAVATEQAELDGILEDLQAELRALMTPQEVSLMDALNTATREEMIRDLKGTGIGATVVDEILKSRDDRSFQSWEDVLQRGIPKLGPQRQASLLAALEAGEIVPEQPVGVEREEQIKNLLKRLPATPADQGVPWQLVFDHPDLPGLKLTIAKTTSQVPTARVSDAAIRQVADEMGVEVSDENMAMLRGVVNRREAQQRTVYHLSFIAPDTGRQLRFRTLSTGSQEVKLPGWWTFQGRADRKIAEVIAAGGSFNEAVEQMRATAQEREVVFFTSELDVTTDEPTEQRFVVLNQSKDKQLLTIQKLVDPRRQIVPEPIQVPAAEVVRTKETAREPSRIIKAQYRMNEDDMLSEIMREARSFDMKAKIIAMGEWRSAIPNLYADTRQMLDGSWLVTMMKRTRGAPGTVVPYDIYHVKQLASPEEVTAYLEERGFSRTLDLAEAGTGEGLKTHFGSLPHVHELTENMIPVIHDELANIVQKHVDELGFAPQPIVDYAQRFTRRYKQSSWNTKHPGQYLGGRRNREAVGVIRLSDHYNVTVAPRARRASADAAQDDLSLGEQALIGGEGFFTPTGRTPVELGQVADDLSIASPVEPSSGMNMLETERTPASPEEIREATALVAQAQHNERFADLADMEFGEPSLRRLADRLVKLDSGRYGIIVDPMYGDDNVVIQTVGKGGRTTVKTVPKDQVSRVRSTQKIRNYYRNAKNALGELKEFPRTQHQGLSPYDRQLGLHGVEDPVKYTAGLRKYIQNVMKRIRVAEDGTVEGDLRPLVPAWIRMHELGISNEIPDTAPVFADPEAQPVANVAMKLRAPDGREFSLTMERGPDGSFINKRTGESFKLDNDKLYQRIGSGWVEAYDVLAKPSRRGLTAAEKAETRIPEYAKPQKERGKQYIPYPLVSTLNRLAREELLGSYSGNSSFGELMARAKLGQLGSSHVRRIEAQAKEFGLDPNAPLWEKIEYLMQYVWDPNVAENLWERHRSLGALWWGQNVKLEGNLPMEFRIPTTGRAARMSVLTAFTFPRTVADMHPTFRYFFHASEKARTEYSNRVKEASDVIGWLQSHSHKMDLNRKVAIMNLLELTELGALKNSPGDVLSRRAIERILPAEALAQLEGWDWYTQYQELATLLKQGRESVLRNSMQRGFTLVPIEIPQDEEGNPKLKPHQVQDLLFEEGLNEAEVQAAMEAMARGQVPVRLERTSRPSSQRPRSEVDAMINLLQHYPEADVIPEQVRATMAPWMLSEFNFWQRYGIKNYVPLISQGKHKLLVRRPDGTQDYVTTVSNLEQAEELVFRMSQGEVPGWAPEDADNIIFKLTSATVDELDTTFLGPRRYKNLYASLMSLLNDEEKAGEITSHVLGKMRLQSERAVPKNLHAQRREADLVTQVIQDPYQRILMYLGRVYRNEYTLGVEHAYESAKNVDRSVSRVAGLDEYFSTADASEYMTSLRDSFMGRPTSFERQANKFIAAVIAGMDIFRRRPGTGRNIIAHVNEQRAHDPEYSVFNDPAVSRWLADPDNISRQWSEQMTTFQSVLRLGFNMSAAGINSLQHFAVTPSYLAMMGASPAKAYEHVLAAYKDAAEYRKQRLALQEWERGGHRGPRPKADLVDFVRDAGTLTVPARGTAGPGVQLNVRNRPMKFHGDPAGQGALNWTKWVMMAPFSLAEDSVRLASTFAGRRHAMDMGWSDAAVLTFARETVDNTQFQYYDQALPPFMRGPLAKMLFQFAQYPVNMIKYEVDLLKGMVPDKAGFGPAFGQVRGMTRVPTTSGDISAQRAALRAQAIYLTNGFITGGLGWAMARPLAQLGILAAKQFMGKDAEDWERRMAARGEEAAISGPEVPNNEFFKLENFIEYGLPGLLSLYASERMGVSGMPMSLGSGTLVFGPTGALFADIYQGLWGGDGAYRLSSSGPRWVIPAAMGAQWLTGRMSGTSLITTPLITAYLWSQVEDTDSDFLEWVGSTEDGRRMINNITPGWFKGVLKTMDIFGNADFSDVESFYDSMEHPTDEWHDPAWGAYLYTGAFDAAWESAMSIAGFQTIPTAEDRAYVSWLRDDQIRRRMLRQSLVDVVASKWEAGQMTPDQMIDILGHWAEKFDVLITENEIYTEVNRRRMDNESRVREQGAEQDIGPTSPRARRREPR